MHSAKKTTAKTPVPGSIIKYGIAHAWDVYTLSQLVNDQIKKGMQPVGAIATMPMMMEGQQAIAYYQTMVQYAPAAVINHTAKNQQQQTNNFSPAFLPFGAGGFQPNQP